MKTGGAPRQSTPPPPRACNRCWRPDGRWPPPSRGFGATLLREPAYSSRTKRRLDGGLPAPLVPCSSAAGAAAGCPCVGSTSSRTSRRPTAATTPAATPSSARAQVYDDAAPPRLEFARARWPAPPRSSLYVPICADADVRTEERLDDVDQHPCTTRAPTRRRPPRRRRCRGTSGAGSKPPSSSRRRVRPPLVASYRLETNTPSAFCVKPKPSRTPAPRGAEFAPSPSHADDHVGHRRRRRHEVHGPLRALAEAAWRGLPTGFARQCAARPL